MNRTLTAALFATVTGATTFGMAGTAAAADPGTAAASDPICDTMHAAENVTFTVDGTHATLTATARPGCEGAVIGIAFYGTAGLAFDPDEVQPLLGRSLLDHRLNAAPATFDMLIPVSTIQGRCRIQVDAYVGGALPEINPTSRFNELAVGVDSNGDGQIANRLIAARYVDQECATPDTTPPTTPTTAPPAAPVELERPPTVAVATPTPAPSTTPAPVELVPPVVALTSTATLPVTGAPTGMIAVVGALFISTGAALLAATRKTVR